MSENQTNTICGQLSNDFAAPLTEPAARLCRTRTFNKCTESFPLESDQFPPIFKASNRFELTPWVYMTPTGLYRSGTTTPVFKVVGELQEEVNFITKHAIEKLNMREASEWTLKEFVGIYLRYSGTRGREYLLDIILVGITSRKHSRRRLRILRPHGLKLILQDDLNVEHTLATHINILVPLSKVGNRFNEFLHIYERAILQKVDNVTLVLIVFGSEVQSVHKTLEEYRNRHRHAQFRVIPQHGEFTRGQALDAGMSTLADSDLTFMCDIDMTFDSTFLDRCRLNAVQGERVYYPEFFKLYDMDYVYRFRRRPADISIKRGHGHWASYSYGMACMYKSDYSKSGGFNFDISGWGGEDVDLFERVLATGIDVLKSPDPSLRHRYHEKMCSLSLDANQFAMCLSSRNEGIADRMQLAEYVYYLERECGIKDRPLWT